LTQVNSQATVVLKGEYNITKTE